MRRGIREMDLILGAFAQTALDAMPEGDLAAYEALLAENDHDLYLWCTGQAEVPAGHAGLVSRVAELVQDRGVLLQNLGVSPQKTSDG
jgi:antitoxin CptB